MPSIMSLVIHSAMMGSSEEIRRRISPRETTIGPDSQTIFSTGGTLRSAERRSCHPLQKLSFRFIFLSSKVPRSRCLNHLEGLCRPLRHSNLECLDSYCPV